MTTQQSDEISIAHREQHIIGKSNESVSNKNKMITPQNHISKKKKKRFGLQNTNC